MHFNYAYLFPFHPDYQIDSGGIRESESLITTRRVLMVSRMNRLLQGAWFDDSRKHSPIRLFGLLNLLSVPHVPLLEFFLSFFSQFFLPDLFLGV